ncbi:MAG: hypothetical protein ABI876_13470 [Bacteroidota bacterium]
MEILRTFWVLHGAPKASDNSFDEVPNPDEVKYYEMLGFDVQGWQNIFGEPSSSPPEVGTYVVELPHISFLQQYVDDNLDPSLYDYFVEMQAEYG